ncbi:glycoside hydrolase family 3 C-terminal domain-containing protein [Salinicoccus sp. HZC-1]|uniref:glycoside hydrolase family 3 C-terminal domain-containing protein n=1 Tax=Salinicoccus sp. HZC-1 TaxID=3385497 RepID=UPI00398B765B
MFSDEASPSTLIRTVEEGYVSEERLDESVKYLLTEMMELGLFENPYVEEERAKAITKDATSQEKADAAHRKSIVLLRNDGDVLPLKDESLESTRLYIEVMQKTDAETSTAEVKDIIRDYDPAITVTDDLDESTHALLFISPLPVPDRPDAPLSVALDAATGIDTDRIKMIERKVPTILSVNMTNPWLINEIEPDAAALLATFGIKHEALIDVLQGRHNPSGKLPFTLPSSQEVLSKSPGDIPGHAQEKGYVYRDQHGNEYGFGYGKSY